MNVYVHTGNGHYIGSAVVVVADNETEGRKLIREYLDANGLQHEVIEIEKTVPINRKTQSEVVYAQNGDY